MGITSPVREQQPRINHVINVCSARDAGTWAVASRYIQQNIAADRYIVIVPDADVKLFEAHQVSAFNVIPETAYVGGLRRQIADRIPEKNSHRTGWYLQQFIKLKALTKGDAGTYSLLWDADTIPLRKLSFIDGSGKLTFYKGHETHAPYFGPIERLLALERQVPFSFIAQCLPYKSDWARELIRAIEQRAQSPWIQALLGAIDFSEESGLSEYELLGTFAYRHYPHELAFTDRPWFRYGGSLVGEPENLRRWPYRHLIKRYDFISIEGWDKDRRMPKWLNCLNGLRMEWMTKGRL